MKKRLKIVNLITLVFLIIAMANAPVSSAAKSDAYGFIKTAGAIGLKSDGSLWSVPQDDGQKYTMISDGYMDIDTDKYENSYIALKKDGTLWVWGKNSMGQFAQSALLESEKPIKIMDNVQAISGLSALKKDGSVWAWGGSVFSETESKVNKPMFLYKGAKSIAYGSRCIYLIDKNSTLYAIRNYYCGTGLIKGNRVKIADNVKCVSNNYYITNDNKLWEITLTEKDIDDNPSVVNNSYDFFPRLILTNVVYTNSNDDSSYDRVNGTSCAIKSDGSLWVWGMDYMPYTSKCNGALPQKLMTGVKYAKCGFKNIKIIKDDGSICYYGIKCPKSVYSIPRVLDRDVSKVYENFSWILTKDDTLMWGPSLQDDDKDRIVTQNASQNVKWNSNGAIINKPDGTKVEYKFNSASDTYREEKYDTDFKKRFGSIIIKNDGTLLEEDLKTFGNSDYKKINIDGANIKTIYTNYDNNLYILYNDNTLFISFGNYIETDDGGSVEYQPPVKLMDDVKDVDFANNYTFAITNSGFLYGWFLGSYTSGTDTIQVKKIMDDVDFFDSKTEMFDIIKKDKSHWNLTCPVLEKSEDNEEFHKEIAQSAYKDIDNMEGLISYCQDYYIKENGELWVRGYGDNTSVSFFNHEIKLNFRKVMDNVVQAGYDNENDRGLALCDDGSLWEYGIVAIREFAKLPVIINEDIKPRKVMDDVKEFRIEYNSCAAVKKDGSLYVWGDNNSGQMGNGNSDFVEKPIKILDDVENAYIYYYSMAALKKDGTIMGWGACSDMVNPRPSVKNPITIAPSDNKISNNSYEAVGLGEDIPICIKVNDQSFTKSAKLVLENGSTISLDKSNSCYFTGKLSGIKNAGILKYYIVASDDNGNEIKSDEYQVKIVNNEKVLLDPKNGEFIAKDFNVVVDGNKIVSDYQPLILIKNGRTLFPVRALSSALKADIKWDGATKTVSVSKKGNNISFKIGSKEVAVNNKKVTIDVPAMIVDEQTMLPVRTICELLGAEVNLDAERQEIIIKSANK
ncbi:MAG: stalk domain-containing protein [Bacillota bacterium]|nr:stalk domain-containing protein [Bacillota bacterium]